MLTLVEGDVGTTLTGTVSADLTDASVAVHILQPDRTTNIKTAAVLDDHTWQITWGLGDLDQIGVHTVEAVVTFPDASQQTFALDPSDNPVRFTVRRRRAA